MLSEVTLICEQMRPEWEQQIGATALVGMEDALRDLVGINTIAFDSPGQIANYLEP